MNPLLVGESNPYGGPPGNALIPDPPYCAGWNLCHKIMQLSERDYYERFDRVNLCHRKWSMKEARTRAAEIAVLKPFPSQDEGGRKFVLLGAKVCKAFELQFDPFTRIGRFTILPHPSGLSRAWAEPGAYERARGVLREAGVL